MTMSICGGVIVVWFYHSNGLLGADHRHDNVVFNECFNVEARAFPAYGS